MSNKKLQELLSQININADLTQINQLANYLLLLQKWNKVYNLTAITNYDKMLKLHIIDSASVFEFIKGNNVLDVGTGAGLPGLVLAVLLPEFNFTLLDSNNKKIRFLRQCQISLDLKNISLIHHRVENFQPKIKFDSIISRAFASLEDFVAKTQNLLAVDGKILAMKGQWDEKYQDKTQVHKISVTNTTRHLVQINQQQL